MGAWLILIESRSQGPVTANINGKNGAASNTPIFTMISITFSKNISFYNEKYYRKTSCFTAFLKIGSMWDLYFFKNISFYNAFDPFLSLRFKNVENNNEFCLLLVQAEAKTYLCSKHLIFTMSYARFFKNISFCNENDHPLQTRPAGYWLGWLRKFCRLFQFFPQALLDGCSKLWLRTKGKQKGGTRSAGKS